MDVNTPAQTDPNNVVSPTLPTEVDAPAAQDPVPPEPMVDDPVPPEPTMDTEPVPPEPALDVPPDPTVMKPGSTVTVDGKLVPIPIPKKAKK